MPICTSCTRAVPYLYTVYASADNLRLEKCPNARCGAFADPYVEHGALTLLLDLVLLKLGVYRHLLYNRGTPPRRLAGASASSSVTGESGAVAGENAGENAGAGANVEEKGNVDVDAVDEGAHTAAAKETARWALLAELGATLVLVDAFIRYTYLHIHPDAGADAIPARWTKYAALAFMRVLLGTTAETLAFHGGITVTCVALMSLLDFVHVRFPPQSPSTSSIRHEFRLSLISFSLFYSSITKLFLLFLLTIWLPAPPSYTPLPPWVPFGSDFLAGTMIERVVSLLDDTALDRAWVVRNVLGGMCAGFGLRVILDIHPVFSTIIILSGWAAKTAVATLLSAWVGGSQRSGEAWLAYSIP
ncbi:hypothetical protein HYPSUDRAFT_87157 [Hypholoma sublateritium FD-334 SS-4]|uniref:Protein ARV n=1 Tax=Hypholoma sublateritium (strain FD-334 SS-4) TaxID=945553 RepID=A0A0D2PSQ7_HYPSF|nr:hypothetical protein HYPSUDRAFT_87157 [Hypholoma sublateritium FD-334 SS-4]